MSMEKYREHSTGFTYDVFLSFRGEDVRHNFIGYLRDALQHRGINAFFDDNNLRIGEDISPALSKAIEESKISVIVFSENYASSRWCLGELVEIIKCTKRNKKQIAFPIFYHVDPSDVRHQRNSYEEAMVANQNRFGKDSEDIKAWIAALSEAADLKGHHINNNRFEIDNIKEIVEKVHANITPKPLLSGDVPVGLEHHTENVKSCLDSTDHTVLLGIYGLGGIGKTELAKSLYNKIVHQFEAASFIANVREKSNKINGLEDLQKTLLSEMFEKPETELGSTSKGIYEIKQKLGKKKVLLVLDDIDNIEQLKILAGGGDWFGPGSRIIITTRDKGLLIGTHSFVVQKNYEMTELNDHHSLELFCQNAFGKSHPETGYEVVSSRAVDYAKGLPLALKVIGSNLATRKSIRAWEHALKDYERTPRKGIQDVLKVSYDVLEPDAQIVFLDISCFFKGERKEYVEEILDEFSAASNINELVNKSLLIVKHGCLDMHDLIQDMGRDIVKQESPLNPAGRSRLWFHDDIIDVLSDENSGSNLIQGIMLDPPEPMKQEDWNDTAFEKANRLRILIVRNTTFSSEPKYLPNHLRLLDWEDYPSKSFPPKFHPKKIIVFKLPKSQLTLEQPFKKFSNLTVMNFSQNEFITVMPDVSEVKNLRELRLDKCKNLIMVHESVGFLEHLTYLSASICPKLRKFLQRMFLPSLEFLDLNLCLELKHFPDIVNKMNKRLEIYMKNTAIKDLPDSIGNLIGLVSIDMTNSWNFKGLPTSLFTLPNVVTLKFGRCCELGKCFEICPDDIPSACIGSSTLKTLHFENSGLSDEALDTILILFLELQELIVSNNNFHSLSVRIKESAHLTNLDVSGCDMLREIPECTNLRILNVHHCKKLQHITKLPRTIQKVDARNCIHLNRDTSNMLWDQVNNERRGLEIVMPMSSKKKEIVMSQMQKEVPDWFDYSCKEGNPHFWSRNQFPIVVLALVFQEERAKKSQQLLVELNLVINGQCVLRKGDYNFRIEPDHVLVCDLRLLFSDDEWLGIDALLLEHEWNKVQVSYESSSSVTLSEWGVFVYKQGTTNTEEYVQFMCPDPKHSQGATLSPIMTTVPSKNPKKEQMKQIESSGIDKLLAMILSRTRDMEEFLTDKGLVHPIMLMLSDLNEEVHDVLKGKPLDDKNSRLALILQTYNGLSDFAAIFDDHSDEMKPPTSVGEASTSGHQGSYRNAEEEEMMREIFLKGIRAGLHEAQSSFPSLDVDTTMDDTFNRGEWVRLSLPEFEVETKIYMEGIINGLLEAKRSFPTLSEWEILNTVLRKEGHNTTEIVIPSYDDPLMLAFMMMKQGSCESERDKSKLFCKLLEEQNALRKKFKEIKSATLDNSEQAHKVHEKLDPVSVSEIEGILLHSKCFQDLMSAIYINPGTDRLLEAQAVLLALDIFILISAFEGNNNEISAQDKDGCLGPSKNQYCDSLEMFNTSFAQYNSKKYDTLGGTNDDSHEKESIISDLKSSLNSTKICADIGKESCKDVTKHEMLAAVLKERENLISLFVAEIKDLQNSKRGQGLIESVKYFSEKTWDSPHPYDCLWWILSICFSANFDDHTDEVKPPTDVGEASTSGHQEILEEQDSDAKEVEIITDDIFLKGMRVGLHEAQGTFPSLDVDTTMLSAFYRGERVRLSLPESEVKMTIYMEGIVNELLEAKRSFPTLKEWEILNTVLRKEGSNTMFQTIDWTEIVVPSYDNPLLLESCESETDKSKLFSKLLEEHNALRRKFEEIENEIAAILDNSKKGHSQDEKLATVLKRRYEELQRLYDAGIEGFQNSNEIQDLAYSNGLRGGFLEVRAVLLGLDFDIITHVFERNENQISAQDKDSCLLPSKNKYGDFLQKHNNQFAQHNSKKDHNPDGNDDSQAKESNVSDLKSSLDSTKICADTGKESCKVITKHKKLNAVLTERREELMRLYDAEIEEFQNSEEIQDLMSATYLRGLRNGVLEAHATLLSLNMDRRTTPMFKENEEHITHEAANDDAVNENHDNETIGIVGILSPTGLEADNPQDTPHPYCCFWRILYTCFCKCFS